MKVQKNIINEIRQTISIVDIISQYISLSKKGNNFVGICPFHDDKHASLTVNETKKIYKCFSCNNAGDVFTFVKNYKNISYFQAVAQCAELANLNKNILNQLSNLSSGEIQNRGLYEINAKANTYFQQFLENRDHEGKTYLAKRGLTPALMKQFGVGFAPNNSTLIADLLTNKNDIVKGSSGYKISDVLKVGLAALNHSGDYHSFFQNRIIFPIRNEDHQVVGFSGRSIDGSDPKYLNTAQTEIFNKSELLYNFDQVLKDYENETIYVAEGFMDVIALARIGITNAVATMGVAFSKDHMQTLTRMTELKSVIVCFDNDQAGQTSLVKTAELLSEKYDVYIVQYETELKDIDEIVNADPELAKKTVNNVINYNSYRVQALIKQTNLENQAMKETLIQKLIKILATYKNDFLLESDIDFISKKLNLDKEIIKAAVPRRMFKSTSTKTKPLQKYEESGITLGVQKHPQVKAVEYSEKTEIEIIKICLLDRQALELFFNTCGIFLYEKNSKILGLIDDFYSKHPEKSSITNTDLKDLTKDPDMIASLSAILLEMRNRNTRYVQERLVKVIESHVLKMHEYNLTKIDASLTKDNLTEQEKEKYYKKLDEMMSQKKELKKSNKR